MQQETTARRRARTSGIMRSAQSIFIILGAVVLFALGIWAGTIAQEWFSPPGPQASPAINPTPTPASAGQSVFPTSAPIEQKSFLVLLVDSRTNSQPVLEGVWLVTFDRGSTNYFFLGFDINQVVKDDRRLVDVFNYASTQTDWGTRLALMAHAVQSLNGGMPIQFTIMLDREALGKAIDAVGGIELNGERVDGVTFIARNSNNALGVELQQQVAQAVFTALKTRGWQAADVQAFYRSLEDPYTLPSDLLIFAIEALPYENSTFIVQLSPK